MTAFWWSKSAIVRASLRTLKNSRVEGKGVLSSSCLAVGRRFVCLRIELIFARPLGWPNSWICLKNTSVTVFFTSFLGLEFLVRSAVFGSSLRLRMMSKRLSRGLVRFLRQDFISVLLQWHCLELA